MTVRMQAQAVEAAVRELFTNLGFTIRDNMRGPVEIYDGKPRTAKTRVFDMKISFKDIKDPESLAKRRAEFDAQEERPNQFALYEVSKRHDGTFSVRYATWHHED